MSKSKETKCRAPDKIDEKIRISELIDERRKQSRLKNEARIEKMFYDVVVASLEDNPGLTTINELESHISKNYRSVVDGFNRRKVIQKVVGDQFLKGNLLIRAHFNMN